MDDGSVPVVTATECMGCDDPRGRIVGKHLHLSDGRLRAMKGCRIYGRPRPGTPTFRCSGYTHGGEPIFERVDS
jgi:hypothetical protein